MQWDSKTRKEIDALASALSKDFLGTINKHIDKGDGTPAHVVCMAVMSGAAQVVVNTIMSTATPSGITRLPDDMDILVRQFLAMAQTKGEA